MRHSSTRRCGTAFVLAVLSALTASVHAQDGKSREAKTRLDRIATVYSKGNAKSAAEQLEVYLKDQPKDAIAWIILGHARGDLGDLDAADVAYGEALKIDPKRVEAITGQGIIYRKREQYDKAMERYQTAVAIDPKYAQAYSSMTTIALGQNKDKEALEYARKGYDLDRSSAVMAANLAVAYHYNGNEKKRDELTREAERLGYRSMDRLKQIYSGELTLRRDAPKQ